jgi:hypothetical protein
MKAAQKPALEAIENVNDALGRLEAVLEKRLKAPKARTEPQLALARNENEVSKKIAARLDQTISRLEMILSEEE